MIDLDMVVPPSEKSSGGNLIMSGFYADGGPALQVVSRQGVEYTATVRLDPLPHGEVWLRNWGGLEGVPEALQKCGAVTLTGKTKKTGFCTAQHARLTMQVPTMAEVEIDDSPDPLESLIQELEREG